MTNCGAALNALVLNQRAVDRSSEGSSGSPATFGRCVPNPANALLLVVCAMASGTPDWSVATPVNVQSLTIAPATPDACRALPEPNGTSHTTDATNACGISPVE